MYTPLVTIAIPIYNAKDYLASAIQSCINQTYLNWELLLMEDGSTDGLLLEINVYKCYQMVKIEVLYIA